MRKLMLLAALLVAAVPAVAEDISQATLDQVKAAATKGYASPDTAQVRNVKKSLATNGTGYCGEVTIEGAATETFTVFHVLLETPKGPSVLRLAEFTNPEIDTQAATVHQMMQHFGCTP